MRKGDSLPSLTNYQWVNGRPKFNDLPILILFWSVSCHDCKGLIRKLVQHRWPFIDNVDFFTVHMPRSVYDTEDEKLLSFCKQQDFKFPILKDDKVEFSDVLQNQYVPSMYLFSSDKTFIGRTYGSQPFPSIEKLYKRHIK